MFPTRINKGNTQLVAKCFFANGKVHYENYSKYYDYKPSKRSLFKKNISE